MQAGRNDGNTFLKLLYLGSEVPRFLTLLIGTLST